MTLIELALAMMIMAIISVGVSSLVRVGVESQLSRRTQENLQIIALNVVDELRLDIRTADSAAISNGGNTLTLTSGGDTIVYSLSGTNMQRVENGGTPKIYNAGFPGLPIDVACLDLGGATTACFRGATPDPTTGVMTADNTDPRQIILDNVTVQQATISNNLIDQNFGRPQFAIRDFAFDMMSATEFR